MFVDVFVTLLPPMYLTLFLASEHDSKAGSAVADLDIIHVSVDGTPHGGKHYSQCHVEPSLCFVIICANLFYPSVLFLWQQLFIMMPKR